MIASTAIASMMFSRVMRKLISGSFMLRFPRADGPRFSSLFPAVAYPIVSTRADAVDEFFGLGAGEDAGRGADGADAACADGAGELQAVELGAAFEQADDVAGVEGVAATGAVDEGDGIGAELDREARPRPRRPRARRG